MEDKLPSWYYERSEAFLTVVNAARNSIDPLYLSQAISIWCKGFPVNYQKWIVNTLGIELTDVIIPPQNAVECAIADFAKYLLEERTQVIFLYRDAWSIASRYRRAGGLGLKSHVSRSTLPAPRQRRYFELFDLVNRAIIQGAGSPSRFRDIYLKEFESYLAHDTSMENYFAKHALAAIMGHGNMICDTGLQGTFAFALAAAIEIVHRWRRPQVRLMVAYPWMDEVLDQGFPRQEIGTIFALERLSASESPIV